MTKGQLSRISNCLLKIAQNASTLRNIELAEQI